MCHKTYKPIIYLCQMIWNRLMKKMDSTEITLTPLNKYDLLMGSKLSVRPIDIDDSPPPHHFPKATSHITLNNSLVRISLRNRRTCSKVKMSWRKTHCPNEWKLAPKITLIMWNIISLYWHCTSSLRMIEQTLLLCTMCLLLVLMCVYLASIYCTLVLIELTACPTAFDA